MSNGNKLIDHVIEWPRRVIKALPGEVNVPEVKLDPAPPAPENFGKFRPAASRKAGERK